jgi:formyltetrahydrofolate deformylase
VFASPETDRPLEVAIGRDVEWLVLARAERLPAEDRVLLTGRRTIVFS